MSRRPFPSEGIRFLDEPATPPPVSVPAESVPLKKRRKGFPVGTLAFLTVVGVGIAMQRGALPVEGSSRARDILERTFDVTPGVTVVIETFNGGVRLEAGETEKVSCVVRRSASAQDEESAKAALAGLVPKLVQEGETIQLKIEKADWYRPGWQGGASLEVCVPRDSVVKVVTRNGDVEVIGLSGELEARTTNGPIKIHEVSGRIVAETSNGPIECEMTDAIVDLKTSNGPIYLAGALAEGESKVVTSNSPVRIRLPEDQSFRLSATTSNGKVDSDFAIDGESKRTRVDGTCGDDPAISLVVRTTNADIDIDSDD